MSTIEDAGDLIVTCVYENEGNPLFEWNRSRILCNVAVSIPKEGSMAAVLENACLSCKTLYSAENYAFVKKTGEEKVFVTREDSAEKVRERKGLQEGDVVELVVSPEAVSKKIVEVLSCARLPEKLLFHVSSSLKDKEVADRFVREGGMSLLYKKVSSTTKHSNLIVLLVLESLFSAISTDSGGKAVGDLVEEGLLSALYAKVMDKDKTTSIPTTAIDTLYLVTRCVENCFPALAKAAAEWNDPDYSWIIRLILKTKNATKLLTYIVSSTPVHSRLQTVRKLKKNGLEEKLASLADSKDEELISAVTTLLRVCAQSSAMTNPASLSRQPSVSSLPRQSSSNVFTRHSLGSGRSSSSISSGIEEKSALSASGTIPKGAPGGRVVRESRLLRSFSLRTVKNSSSNNHGKDSDNSKNASPKTMRDSPAERRERTERMKELLILAATPRQKPKGTSCDIIKPEELVIGKELGVGASATVYHGVLRGQIEVAVKVLARQDVDIKEFMQEMTVMASLSNVSNSVIKLFGVVTQGKCSIVMEYCSNGSLHHVLKTNRTLTWEIILSMLVDCAQGLSVLHERDIVHRDVKTLNFLVTKDFSCKIADLGQADKVAKVEEGLKGTLVYNAPELFKGEAYTTKCDIYSFGIVLWESFNAVAQGVHEAPYAEYPNMRLDFQIVIQVSENNVRPTIADNMSDVLANLIKECWDADPDTRPKADSVLKALKKCYDSAKNGKFFNLAIESKEVRRSARKARALPMEVEKVSDVPKGTTTVREVEFVQIGAVREVEEVEQGSSSLIREARRASRTNEADLKSFTVTEVEVEQEPKILEVEDMVISSQLKEQKPSWESLEEETEREIERIETEDDDDDDDDKDVRENDDENDDDDEFEEVEQSGPSRTLKEIRPSFETRTNTPLNEEICN